MTSRNWYFRLAKEDLKRRVWLIALTAIVFFFSFPVIAMIYAGMIDTYRVYEQGLAQFQKNMLTLISTGNAWMFFLIVVWAIVYGISSFSYLNSKSQVDFYHSIPVRREKLFCVFFVQGFLMMAVLYLIFLFLALVLGAANGADISLLLVPAATTYVLNLTYFLLLYATVIVAVMLTGNRIVTLLGIGVFFFYMPIMGALLEGFSSMWLLTYWSHGNLVKLGRSFSPLMLVLDSYSLESLLKSVLIGLGAGIAVTLAALWLYKKRPSEGAGKSLVFPLSKPIIQIAIVICSGMAGAAFGWGIRSSLSWSLFFLACGVVVSHCVIEIIYHMDFKQLFSSRLQLGSCVLLTTLLVFGFRYDLLGFDRYVPKTEELQAVSIDVSSFDDWVEYGTLTDEDQYLLYTWRDRTEHLFDTMKLTEPSQAVALAAIGSHLAVNGRESRFDRDADFEEMEASVTVYMQFIKTGGRTVTRCYQIPIDDAEAALSALLGQDEYKEAMYPILTQEEDLVAVYYERYVGGEMLWQEDTAKAEKLREAYCQDLREQRFEQIKTEIPLATIRMVTVQEDLAIREHEYNWSSWQGDSLLHENRYPIYPSFARTIACLAEGGITVTELASGIEITGGELRVWTGASDEDYMMGYHDIHFLTAEEGEAILPYLNFVSSSGYMNNFRITDDSIGVTLTISGEGMPYNRDSTPATIGEFYFLKDQVPEWIERKVKDSF